MKSRSPGRKDNMCKGWEPVGLQKQPGVNGGAHGKPGLGQEMSVSQGRERREINKKKTGCDALRTECYVNESEAH